MHANREGIVSVTFYTFLHGDILSNYRRTPFYTAITLNIVILKTHSEMCLVYVCSPHTPVAERWLICLIFFSPAFSVIFNPIFSKTESLLFAKILIPWLFFSIWVQEYTLATVWLHVTRWHGCIYIWNLTMENRKDPWQFLDGILKEKGSKLQSPTALIVLYWAWPMLYNHVGRKITHYWFCYCNSEDRVMTCVVVRKSGRLSQQHNTIIMRDFNSSHLNCISIITVI